MPSPSTEPRLTAPSMLGTALALLITYGLMRATLSINPRSNPRRRRRRGSRGK